MRRRTFRVINNSVDEDVTLCGKNNLQLSLNELIQLFYNLIEYISVI